MDMLGLMSVSVESCVGPSETISFVRVDVAIVRFVVIKLSLENSELVEIKSLTMMDPPVIVTPSAVI